MHSLHEQIHAAPPISTERCWFPPAADMTQVTTPCSVPHAGWRLEAFCWSLVTQDPVSELGPTCLHRTHIFILAVSARCACPTGSPRVTQEQAAADMLAGNGKWRCTTRSNEKKMLKKCLFFFFSHFPSQELESQRAPEHCGHSSPWWREMFLSLLLPSPCQLAF